jgi:hypothetical protein
LTPYDGSKEDGASASINRPAQTNDILVRPRRLYFTFFP